MQITLNNRVIFLSFLGIFLLSLAVYIDSYSIKFFLLSKGFSGEQLSHLKHIEMLGYIISGFILTQLANSSYFNLIPFISATILTIATFNMLIINEVNFFLANGCILAIALFSYVTSTLVNILEFSSKFRYLFLSFSLIAWVIAHNIVDVFNSLINPGTESIILCALVYTIIMLITLLNKNVPINYTDKNSKFSILIENMELQLLAVFVISYLTFDILWYYEAYALKKKLTLSEPWEFLHYMLQGVLVFIMPISYLITKVNKHSSNLILTLTLIFSLALLPLYGITIISSISCVFLIGACLASIFVCNILILADKFEAQELRSAFFIYFSMGAIGMYAGALSSHVPFGMNNKEDFLFSIAAIIYPFIFYYIWYFIKYKLYRAK